MAKITEIQGRKILDSRGEPTIEVKVATNEGFIGIDSVPSGTSTGGHEDALVPVDKAVLNVNNIIAPKLIGIEVEDQTRIDQIMIDLDGTEDKSKLGANAILGVSLAICRTAAIANKMPLYKYINKLFRQVTGIDLKPKLPEPMMVMICGGKHGTPPAGESENNLCIQEFLVIAKMEDGIKIWNMLEKVLKHKQIAATFGLEGAFSLKLPFDEDAIKLIVEAIEECGLNLGKDVRLGLDIAGNHCRMSNNQIVELFRRYDIFSIEDPFGETEWDRFGQLKVELEELNRPFLLIGDDLFATHKDLLQKGISKVVANGIIIKVNQVGTLTEVLDVTGVARRANYTCVVSHRSGETIDSFIADLAVGIGAAYLKAGAPIPNERLLKYKRLKEIEQEL